VFDIGYSFNQTWWFKAAAGALAAAALYLMYRWRLRRATARIEERVHAQLEERERIARTLHDTFLQGVYGLVLRIQAVAAQLPEGMARSALESAMRRADQLLDEGREQVRCLRNATPPSPSLDAALRMEAQAIESEYGIKVTASLELPPVSAEVADELYAICRQALANAARHSEGSLVELTAQHTGGKLRLSVKDNGKGMPDHVSQGLTPGHYGIVGMRERAAAIGAELAIASGPEGTEITLSLPVPE
jgi:signal transduction histidine kinase